MPKTTIAATTYASKTVLSSTLFGSMVIFNDPAYIIVALLGAVIAMISAYNNILEAAEDNKYEKTALIMELLKTFTIGFIVSLLSFLLLLNIGNQIAIKYLPISEKIILPSVWFAATLVISSFSISLYNKFQATIVNYIVVKRKKQNEDYENE